MITAAVAVLALAGAAAQIHVTRAIARRQLVYNYLQRFNSKETLERNTRYREFWKNNDWATYEALDTDKRVDLVILPNLIEEVAGLYNRRLLDRTLAALTLGPSIEHLWDLSPKLVAGARMHRSEWAYCEWGPMQADTRMRRLRANERSRRRHAWQRLVSGRGPT